MYVYYLCCIESSCDQMASIITANSAHLLFFLDQRIALYKLPKPVCQGPNKKTYLIQLE